MRNEVQHAGSPCRQYFKNIPHGIFPAEKQIKSQKKEIAQ